MAPSGALNSDLAALQHGETCHVDKDSLETLEKGFLIFEHAVEMTEDRNAGPDHWRLKAVDGRLKGPPDEEEQSTCCQAKNDRLGQQQVDNDLCTDPVSQLDTDKRVQTIRVQTASRDDVVGLNSENSCQLLDNGLADDVLGLMERRRSLKLEPNVVSTAANCLVAGLVLRSKNLGKSLVVCPACFSKTTLITELGDVYTTKTVLPEVDSDIWVLTDVAGFDNGADIDRHDEKVHVFGCQAVQEVLSIRVGLACPGEDDNIASSLLSSPANETLTQTSQTSNYKVGGIRIHGKNDLTSVFASLNETERSSHFRDRILDLSNMLHGSRGEELHHVSQKLRADAVTRLELVGHVGSNFEHDTTAVIAHLRDTLELARGNQHILEVDTGGAKLYPAEGVENSWNAQLSRHGSVVEEGSLLGDCPAQIPANVVVKGRLRANTGNEELTLSFHVLKLDLVDGKAQISCWAVQNSYPVTAGSILLLLGGIEYEQDDCGASDPSLERVEELAIHIPGYTLAEIGHDDADLVRRDGWRGSKGLD
ncbi:hypothetical protein HG530_008057 [Fusarium avenaceum]|nr:hypothetical protein HG530_008057 [Fusarium avenaceum]